MGSFAENPAAESGAGALVRSLPLRDRFIILSALGIVILLAWIYLLKMPGMAMAEPVWTADYFVAMFLMWGMMMVGMMVPSAIPTVLIHAAVSRKAASASGSFAPTTVFVSGYILVWGLFSVGATLAQFALDRAALLSPMMTTNSRALGGLLLLAAGLYQLTPLKDECLRHCRSPVHFIARGWRPGYLGAMRLGVMHGAYCLGCCWILMGLLFFGGVMSIWWIGGLTLFVLLEKVIPFGRQGGRVAGLLATAWGLFMLFSSFSAGS